MNRAPSERRILADIRLALGVRPDIFIQRHNTMKATELRTGRVIQSSPNGTADILGSVKLPSGVGLALAVEVKSESGRLSDEQVLWGLVFAARGGGLYVVARSAKDATAAVDAARVDPALEVARSVEALRASATRRGLSIPKLFAASSEALDA